MVESLSALRGRRVVLGVCGGIAAYKAVELCRRLMDAGAVVSPVLTGGALRFVGAPTFNALASERVKTSLFDDPDPIPHTRLGQAADLVIVAPATARLLGAYAAGISSDLLTATLLATRAPVIVCPAMHTEMWEHPAVQDNVATLRRRGVVIVGPASGRLAGGDSGAGRLAEVAEVLAAAAELAAAGAHRSGLSDPGRSDPQPSDPGRSDPQPSDPGPSDPELFGVAPSTREPSLAGVRAVVSAGGTREPIDPVRFVGNRSSGKQGHALAAELAARGASVTLITTTELAAPGVDALVKVETAAQMEAAVLTAAAEAQVVIMAAAVADFRPRHPAAAKIKKQAGLDAVELEPTTDILAALGARRRPGQVLVGFAAETAGGEELVTLARAKLQAKAVDMIVANDVTAPGVGFGHDTNAVTIVGRHRVVPVSVASKRVVAAHVVDAVAALLDPPTSLPAMEHTP
jgi:phosphopantothenoylcysteine decarboxylase/phosphopantothenate--cysteine ligase